MCIFTYVLYEYIFTFTCRLGSKSYSFLCWGCELLWPRTYAYNMYTFTYFPRYIHGYIHNTNTRLDWLAQNCVPCHFYYVLLATYTHGINMPGAWGKKCVYAQCLSCREGEAAVYIHTCMKGVHTIFCWAMIICSACISEHVRWITFQVSSSGKKEKIMPWSLGTKILLFMILEIYTFLVRVRICIIYLATQSCCATRVQVHKFEDRESVGFDHGTDASHLREEQRF